MSREWWEKFLRIFRSKSEYRMEHDVYYSCLDILIILDKIGIKRDCKYVASTDELDGFLRRMGKR